MKIILLIANIFSQTIVQTCNCRMRWGVRQQLQNSGRRGYTVRGASVDGNTNALRIFSAMTLKIFSGCNNKGESPVEADLVRRSSDQRAVGPHSRPLRLQVSLWWWRSPHYPQWRSFPTCGLTTNTEYRIYLMFHQHFWPILLRSFSPQNFGLFLKY